MVKFFCVIVGEASSAFPVNISETESVGDLKKAIADDQKFDFAANKLELSLAKKDEGWLPSAELGAIRRGEKVPNFERVSLVDTDTVPYSTISIGKVLEMNEMPSPQTEEIHVLVEAKEEFEQNKRRRVNDVPQIGIEIIPNKTMTSIKPNLNFDAWSVGGINLNINEIEPDFPKWFYVRMEALNVIEVFKNQLGEEHNVVCMGTPGVGKSMLVVLFAFYMALIERKRVVLFRVQKTRKRAGFSMLYLDGQSEPPVFWRKNRAAIGDIAGLKNEDFELCLDGLLYKHIDDNYGILGQFRLLATSAQYQFKNDDVMLKQCLVPYWSLPDLKKIGEYHQWSESDITDRYYYSGGNLRDFLSAREDVEESIQKALRLVEPVVAELLNTQYGTASVSQVDRIRMTGIPENNFRDLKKYMYSKRWACVITSDYALRQLGNIVKPLYYEELWHKATQLGDDGLKGVAFENYVHSLARVGKKIKLRVRMYDREKVTEAHTYEDLNIEPKSYSNDGNDAAECDGAMKKFASSSNDYWYPCCRDLETIDCVARLSMNGQSNLVALIQITKSENHKIASKAINKYARFFPNGCIYIALVPFKATADEFRLSPTKPSTKVPLKVAHFEQFPQPST